MCIRDEKRAIKTRYNGTLYRSKTEAKFAFILDKLGIKFEYEPEGFEAGDTRYLPDFYLPREDKWIEVKGFFETVDYEKIHLLEEEFGAKVYIGYPDLVLTTSEDEELYYTEEDGFTTEPTFQPIYDEVVTEAKRFNFEMEEPLVVKDFVEEDPLTRLIDLKATYLNDYYDIQYSYPRIINHVMDTMHGGAVRTNYVIYITAAHREDFTITLFDIDKDREIFHISVKEIEVKEAVRKVFRIGYLLHDSPENQHEEILSQKITELASYLRTRRQQ